MYTRSEFFAGPGKGKYYPEQVGIKCWNAWDEEGTQVKAVVTSDWQNAPRIWKQGHIETFQTDEHYLKNDIHQKQADETVAKLVVQSSKNVKPDSACILTPMEINRRIANKTIKDANKKLEQEERGQSRSPRGDGEGGSGDTSGGGTDAEDNVVRRAPTIIQAAAPAQAAGPLKRTKSSQSLAGKPTHPTSPGGLRSPSRIGGSATGGDAAPADSPNAALASCDQHTLKWSNQCDKVCHAQALNGKSLGRERNTLRIYGDEAQAMGRHGEASKMFEHRALNEEFESLATNHFGMMFKVAKTKLDELMAASKDKHVEWATNASEARIQREIKDWTQKPESIKEKFDSFVDIGVPWLLEGETDMQNFDPCSPKYRHVQGTALEKCKWFLKTVIDEILTPLITAGLQHKGELTMLLGRICDLCDKASENKHVSEEYDDGLELLIAICRGIARIIEREPGIHGSTEKDVDKLEEQCKKHNCTILATLRAVKGYKDLYIEYTQTKRAQKELVPLQTSAIKKLNARKAGDLSGIALDEIAKQSELFKRCSRELRPTQAVKFEAAMTKAIDDCESVLLSKLSDGSDQGLPTYSAIQKFIKAVNEVFGTSVQRDQIKAIIDTQSRKQDRAKHVAELAAFGDQFVLDNKEALRIKSEDIDNARALIDAVAGHQLESTDPDAARVQHLLNMFESAFTKPSQELEPQEHNSLALARSLVSLTKALRELLYKEVDANSPTSLYMKCDGNLESCMGLINLGTDAEQRLKSNDLSEKASAANSALQELTASVEEHGGANADAALLKVWNTFTANTLNNIATADLPTKKGKAESAVNAAFALVEELASGKWSGGKVTDDPDEFINFAVKSLLEKIDIQQLAMKIEAADHHIKKGSEKPVSFTASTTTTSSRA